MGESFFFIDDLIKFYRKFDLKGDIIKNKNVKGN